MEETVSWTTANVEAIRELQSKTAAYVREAPRKAFYPSKADEIANSRTQHR